MEFNMSPDPEASVNVVPPSPGLHKAKKKRVRNWTAEDRAVHREFEKSRREAFSERLAVCFERNTHSSAYSDKNELFRNSPTYYQC